MRMAIGEHRQLGEARVGSRLIKRVFAMLLAALTATHEIGTAVTGLQTGTVGSAALDDPASPHQVLYGRSQELLTDIGAEEALCGLMQRGMIGNPTQPQPLTDGRKIADIVLGSAIVGTQEDHERETGEELGLSKDLGAAGVRVVREGFLANREGLQDHLPW